MKYEDMGPGPVEIDNGNGNAVQHDSTGDLRRADVRTEPVSPGIVHPDLIEAAIRMLADQGYRVFKSKDVKAIEASYAIRPSMTESDEFEHLARSRVLQDVSINVASSPGVRWTKKDGTFGRLLTAKVLVVLPGETEV